MRAGGGAAVGVVAELMDVETTLGIGVVARDVPADGGWARLGGLLEGDGAADVGVTTENSNCRLRSARNVLISAHLPLPGGTLRAKPRTKVTGSWNHADR